MTNGHKQATKIYVTKIYVNTKICIQWIQPIFPELRLTYFAKKIEISFSTFSMRFPSWKSHWDEQLNWTFDAWVGKKILCMK